MAWSLQKAEEEMKKVILCTLICFSFSCANASECNPEQLKQFRTFWDSVTKDIETIVDDTNRDRPICEMISYEDTLYNDVIPAGKSEILSGKYCAECLDFCTLATEKSEKELIRNNYLDCNFYVSISIQKTSCSTYFGF